MQHSTVKHWKFLVRVILTFIVLGFGISIFFTMTDPNLRHVGTGLVSFVFGTWMSSGSSKITKAVNPKSTKPDGKPDTTSDAITADNIDSILGTNGSSKDQVELKDVKVE